MPSPVGDDRCGVAQTELYIAAAFEDQWLGVTELRTDAACSNVSSVRHTPARLKTQHAPLSQLKDVTFIPQS